MAVASVDTLEQHTNGRDVYKSTCPMPMAMATKSPLGMHKILKWKSAFAQWAIEQQLKTKT